MVNTSLTIGSIAALIFSGIFLGGLSFFSPALLPLRQNPVYSLVFVILALASTATILLANTFIARRQAVFTMLSSLISSMVRLPLPILFVLFIPSFIGINLALCAALVVAVFISLLFFVPKTLPGFRPVPTISRPIIRGMLHFSFTNYIANALMAFTIYVIPLMVINLLSAEANAYFYISWTIGGVLSTISSGTTASLFAEGAFNETKFVADIWRSLKMTYILLIPAALIVFLLANRLLLLFGRDYSIQGTTLFRTMVLAALVVSLNGIFMSVLRVKKRIATLILMVAVIAVVTITTSYLLLPHIGINAPGIGWLAGQSIVAVYVAFKLLKLAKTGQI
jgi:O-antigen/teichoic acid export membrane protein